MGKMADAALYVLPPAQYVLEGVPKYALNGRRQRVIIGDELAVHGWKPSFPAQRGSVHIINCEKSCLFRGPSALLGRDMNFAEGNFRADWDLRCSTRWDDAWEDGIIASSY